MKRKLLVCIITIFVCLNVLSIVAYSAEGEFDEGESGVKIIGEVESYNPGADIEVYLVLDDEIRYTATVDGVSEESTVKQSFVFSGVEAGTYDLIVQKENHLTYTVADVSVSDSDIDLTQHESEEISLIRLQAGDINSDGCIDVKDVIILTADGTYNVSYDEVENKDADINGDECFDVRDLIIITLDYNYNTSPKEVNYGHEHAYVSSELLPTCTKSGGTIYTCSVCGEGYLVLDKKPLGHTEVTDSRVEPTCTKTGLTEGSHCSVCNEVFVKQETIPMTDHVPGDWVEDIAPTYSEMGHKYIPCTSCGTTVREAVIPAIFSFTLNSDGESYTLSSIGSCTDAVIKIPDTYNGLPVTVIGKRVFASNDKITKVILPDSITRIDDYAFRWCHSLAEINIPEDVTYIGYSAFAECMSMSSLVIPDSVTVIGEYAFIDCAGLSSVVLSKNVTKLDYAFWGCSSLTEIELPEGITSIAYAFGSCRSLKKVNFPSTLKTIGPSAFEYAAFTSIDIPATVTVIDKSAFRNCAGLESVTTSATKIEMGAFWGCKLNTINYRGTVSRWKAVTKGNSWDNSTPEYTVYCLDGAVTKSGTVSYY